MDLNGGSAEQPPLDPNKKAQNQSKPHLSDKKSESVMRLPMAGQQNLLQRNTTQKGFLGI